MKIKLTTGEFVEQEPTVGKWYVATTIRNSKDGEWEDHGCLGRYEGFGTFDDEGSDVTEAMEEADYLTAQL